MGFFQRLFARGGGASNPPPDDEDLGATLVRLHRAYWSPAPDEKQRLQAATIEGLSWRDLLRLHHLVCLDLLHAAGLTEASEDALGKMLELPEGPDAELYARLVERLRGPTSPYRPRQACIFQRRRVDPTPARPEPDLRGELSNASLTHLAALEVIKLEGTRPTGVDFVPFEALHSVHLGPPSLFPPARLDYVEAGRGEVVALPLLYGASWFSARPSDRDGSMTHFVCHLKSTPGGIGLGHQDFTAGGALFGLGSIEAIEFQV